MCNWVTLLYRRNWHSSVNQLYVNKLFFKKRNRDGSFTPKPPAPSTLSPPVKARKAELKVSRSRANAFAEKTIYSECFCLSFLLEISPSSSCLFSLWLSTSNVGIYLQGDYIYSENLDSEAAFQRSTRVHCVPWSLSFCKMTKGSMRWKILASSFCIS